ncbi:advanced glycosylation end product-specific receptor isoform X4 [Heterocephalus glaber]|uniref:Advanced glycosylation end product-specific receptor isoform X4 n=1 Tax=Heterocephalus glaber TaxID=10181 RepID=A0AAX6T720_HETGA|nr:advanced glycosylation end product-specific receptor isoform X4 [Heterocephalus glaber]
MAARAAAGTWVLVLSLWGAAAAVGGQNVTARIGKPLVLNCKGAPKKPPQQLEWKLNTGRTEAWKVLSPQGGPWDSVARVLPNGSLLLPAVGIQDEGTFRCRARNRHGKETKSTYRVGVYQIPGKPEIVDPASGLIPGVPNKVGTCVSEGGYPAGTLSWHLDGKPLEPDGKEPVPLGNVQLVVEPAGGTVAPGGSVTLTCEAPAQPTPEIHWVKDGARLSLPPSPVLLLPEVRPQDQGTYSCVAMHPSHEPQESPAVSISIVASPSELKKRKDSRGSHSLPRLKPFFPSDLLQICLPETDEEGQAAGSVGGSGLGTLALALGTLAGLGIAALLTGVIVWRRRQHQGKERKVPESQEEQEERAGLNQSEVPETAGSSTGGP